LRKIEKNFFNTVRDFLTIYLPKQKCVSENTIKSYRETISLFLDYLTINENITLESISFDYCNYNYIISFLDWLQSDRKCSSSTRNQRLYALKSFIKYAGIKYPEYISLKLELDNIPVQKKKAKLIETFSEEALSQILTVPDTNSEIGIRNLCFMILMYDTAARDREMLDLTLGSLYLTQKQPSICLKGKGNKTRIVPIMDTTVNHLNRYLSIFHPLDKRKNTDFLFYTKIHEERHQMSDDNVAKFIKKYAKLANEKGFDVPQNLHPHMFRHARAIHLYRRGMPLSLLSEFMGHASVQTTTIYAYADTEMKRNAINKASCHNNLIETAEEPDWKKDNDLIRKLYGLK
jgi:integrase/recombinase XerD